MSAAAYPGQADQASLAESVASMSHKEQMGLAAGIKGKLFELRYVDHLNAGHLPEGYTVVLAEHTNQPGWYVAIHGPDGAVANALQLKSTPSTDYLREALERYPHIDVAELRSAAVGGPHNFPPLGLSIKLTAIRH